ncbi:MAG: type IV pilin N-terminal domain-containing protein [Methanosarcinaceae archaeon]|nr:type IV pilin N-terminal domain-containing protein [Methanosarcinaceae archaeon]
MAATKRYRHNISNRSLFKNERAVSDVVGSIMMVTITVIMATVVATAIFSMKPPVDVPHVSIEITENGSHVDLIHMGGEPLDTSKLNFMVEGVPVNINTSSPINITEDWTIGTTIILDTNNTIVKIVHRPSKELLT